MRQKINRTKGKNRDFSIAFRSLVHINKTKISMGVDLNSTIKQVNLIEIYRMLYLTNGESACKQRKIWRIYSI